MSTALQPVAGWEVTDDDDDEVHTTCCHNNTRALCGAVLLGEWEDTDESASCVVCADLRNGPSCPLYGFCLDD